MSEYGFSLTEIFPCKDRIYDSIKKMHSFIASLIICQLFQSFVKENLPENAQDSS